MYFFSLGRAGAKQRAELRTLVKMNPSIWSSLLPKELNYVVQLCTPFPWFMFFLIFSLLEHCVNLCLDIRQYRHLTKRSLPKALKGLVEPEVFEKSVNYSLDKLTFGILKSSIFTALHFALYLTLFYPLLWTYSGELCLKYLGYSSEYTQSIVFMGLQTFGSRCLSIPFELYADFVLEARHGFNKKTLSIFIFDELKTLMLMGVIGVPFMYLIIWIIHWGGKTFYFWLWGASMAFTLIMMTIYPNVIAPLFNKFEELKNADLKIKIEALASRIRYPLKKIYQMDASTRSTHSNAYLYGFGNNKRMVLFDTLLDSPEGNILAVVGHELGHWKYSHTLKMLILSSLQLFGMFYLFGLVFYNPHVYTEFGFDAQQRPAIIGLFIFMNIFEPISLITSMFSTCLSRRFEFQADAFSAVELDMNRPLRSALVELQIKNLTAFSVDPWYEWMHYSHPHLVKRLDALERLEQKQQ